MVKHFKTYG